jgi:hypothetical protein
MLMPQVFEIMQIFTSERVKLRNETFSTLTFFPHISSYYKANLKSKQFALVRALKKHCYYLLFNYDSF